jgi:hypothetical protein
MAANLPQLIRNQTAMKKELNKLFVLILICGAALMQSSLLAATIPAGTPLIVRTAGAISSHATAGRAFTAKLDQDVVINGNAALRAGTQLSGIIASSRGSRSTTSSQPLTLNLTAVAANGRMVPIKTTGGVQPHAAKTTRQSRGGFSYGESIFPAGTRLEFRLAQPLHL